MIATSNTDMGGTADYELSTYVESIAVDILSQEKEVY